MDRTTPKKRNKPTWFIICFLFVVKGPAADVRLTAALRLIVQPCDTDEEKDDPFFFIFRSNGAPVE
jgi:hypothetical protein